MYHNQENQNNEQLYYSNSTPVREELVRKIEKAPKNKEGKKNLTILILQSILITLLVSVLGIGTILIIVSRVNISNLQVTGNISFPQDMLLKQMQIQMPTKYFALDTRFIQGNLEAHPLIYSAQVKKTVFGDLNIHIERSQPIISILIDNNGIDIPSYFDKEGRCVQVGIGQGIVDVPILSGVKLVNPTVGIYLPEWLQKFTHDLDTIKKEDNNLFRKISEVNIKDRGDGYRVLELFFIEKNARFITDIQITTQKLKKIWELANKFATNPKFNEFEYFDIRQGIIVGKKREIL